MAAKWRKYLLLVKKDISEYIEGMAIREVIQDCEVVALRKIKQDYGVVVESKVRYKVVVIAATDWDVGLSGHQ